MKISYEDAGVSIDNANAFVEAIKPLAKQTFNDNVIGTIGSFSGAFRMPSGFEKPVILGATDGVGTKLRLAIDCKKYDSIGEDLVAMCVNDLICNFATPLFFLDYYATAKLQIHRAKKIVEGIVRGCKLANCALIGGETAQMPKMYANDDFDLAGFAVGIAEEDEIDRTHFVKNGDILVALASSGLHSNGYSLATKVLFETLKLKFDDKIGGKNIIDILLEPTIIYVPHFLALKPYINALAHITGGGIIQNLARVLPPSMGANIRKHELRTPEIFHTIAQAVEESQMYRSFNMGVGLIMIVDPSKLNEVLKRSDAFIIGEITMNEGIVLE